MRGRGAFAAAPRNTGSDWPDAGTRSARSPRMSCRRLDVDSAEMTARSRGSTSLSAQFLKAARDGVDYVATVCRDK